MKKNYFQIAEEINPDIYLLYNSYSNAFLLLNKTKFFRYSQMKVSDLENSDPEFYKVLLDNQFIISDDIDEFEVAAYRKKCYQFNSSTYQVMINTTLDCNLNCWYCYENRIARSYLKENVAEAVKRNIEYEYTRASYNCLKVSFFGGEPLLYFNSIKSILDFSKEFCRLKKIKLIADFTTNAVLINYKIVDYLKDFDCLFQITLDGDRFRHNQVKKDKFNPDLDTYEKTLNALHLIDKEIPNRLVSVRINFDNKTLEKIDDIINDLNFLDRRHCFVIVKKVWQLKKDKVDVPLLHAAIQKLMNNRFYVDYYLMPRGNVCFAERQREILFNFDGKIFKCSTLSSFDEINEFGKFDLKTGHVFWNEIKLAYWLKEMLPENCLKCKLLPACLGPCNKQIMQHRGENICTFDAINMTIKEYLLYLFKNQLVEREIYK